MDVPVYPESTVVYSWAVTEGGSSQTQPCPTICQEVTDYPSGAVVERVCQRESGQWMETNITRCGLSITALQLCETTQVCCGKRNNFKMPDVFLFFKLEGALETASAVVNITGDASVLESSAIALTSGIIRSLTEAAIEDTQVYCTLYLVQGEV